MRVFLDFEASSLAKAGYPIEVAWVFQDGREETHLILPAQEWTDWDTGSEAVHGIARATLLSEGTPHEVVARRMVEQLTGHDLFASAPSWDGKWLSALLRAADLPRHALRLRDTDDAQMEIAREVLGRVADGAELDDAAKAAIAQGNMRANTAIPAHRALADARGELGRWLAVRAAAEAQAAGRR